MGDLQTIFQSTLSVRRATGAGTLAAYQVTLFQSTLSVRRATQITGTPSDAAKISIHDLREESDSRMTSRLKPQDGFQSTLSVRRATSVTSNATTLPKFQSTLSVRRATRWLGHGRPSDDISIHALREESDRRRHARGLPGHIISIHALREESDRWLSSSSKRSTNFNPRSP